MPEKPKAFLTSVKEDITEAFASVYDDLSEITSDEDKLGTALKTVQKQVWDIVEKQLKQSYLNGKKAGNGTLPAEDRKPNPFRR